MSITMLVGELEADLELSQQIALHHCRGKGVLSSQEAREVLVSVLTLTHADPSSLDRGWSDVLD